MNAHTPGPWSVGARSASGFHGSLSGPAGTKPIGDIYRMETPEGEANARLAAAAPELLTALQRCADCMEARANGVPNTAESKRTLDQARAAIAKAQS